MTVLSLCKSLCVGVKLLYDGRKTLGLCAQDSGSLISSLTARFGRLFVLSEILVDIDVLREELPEECMKFLLPPPDRKMVLVANLKMNGNAARLERYCECLNNTVVCLDKKAAGKARGRKYKTQLYPDLVDVVIAPPYPYLESVSQRLRRDCLDCRDCEDCQDCAECAKCDCDNCKNCKVKRKECCEHKCFDFSNCEQQGCTMKTPQCEMRGGSCQCDDCGLCTYCQTCYRTDCEDCSICIQTAAQNSFPFISGGFSGEVSPRQIREMGGRWVIIGSSERRELFHETDELIAHKVRCALLAKMKVVLCISDSMKDDNNTDDLEKQMMTVIPKIGKPVENEEDTSGGNPSDTPFRWNGTREKGYFSIDGVQDWKDVVIVYEPVWALKKGLVPTPLQAQIKCNSIREILEDEVGNEMASKIRILYGGPVDSESAPEYANMPAIDGFLIGTTAFKLDELVKIANAWFIKNRPDAADTEPPDLGPDGLPCPEEDEEK